MLKCVYDAKISRSGDFHADNDRQTKPIALPLASTAHARVG